MRTLPLDKAPEEEIRPWHSLGGIEHICELRKSCAVLYGIFVELARLVYHDTDGRLVGTPDVVWNRDKPSIWIDTELRWEDEHPEFRPAIYVQLGQLRHEEFNPGMNGKVTPPDRFGVYHFEQKVSGTVTFMHVASTVGEACALADNTEYNLALMQQPICDDFCFTRFVMADRLPLEKLQDEASEKYASSVTFAFEFADAWDVTPETPILKSIDFINSSRHDRVSRANILPENKMSGEPGQRNKEA